MRWSLCGGPDSSAFPVGAETAKARDRKAIDGVLTRCNSARRRDEECGAAI